MKELPGSRKLYSKLEQLYPPECIKKRASEISKYKLKVIIWTTFIIVVVNIILLIFDTGSRGKNIVCLDRNDTGSGNRNVTVKADFAQIDKSTNLTIEVKEKELSREQIEELSGELGRVLWTEILGDNTSLNQVSKDLNLMEKLEGFPFQIKWTSQKPLLISAKGILNSKRIKEEIEKSEEEREGNEPQEVDGIPVQLCATLTYANYSEDIYGYIRLVAPDKLTYEEFLDDLNEQIKKSDELTATYDRQVLPEKVDGISVLYTEKSENAGLVVLIMGLVIIAGLLYGKDKEIDRQIKEKKEELEKDYPKIINQYALYYCAGMGYRNIWISITDRYKKHLEKDGHRHFVYEEMIRVNQRIKDGCGEMAAYEEFARRCQSVKYRAFISIVEQSIKKGRDDLYIILNDEMQKARNELNNRVRMSAQELSTKLLFPMILMLLIVLVVVMVPAFISFN